jgi:hypothetical protein
MAVPVAVTVIMMMAGLVAIVVIMITKLVAIVTIMITKLVAIVTIVSVAMIVAVITIIHCVPKKPTHRDCVLRALPSRDLFVAGREVLSLAPAAAALSAQWGLHSFLIRGS